MSAFRGTKIGKRSPYPEMDDRFELSTNRSWLHYNNLSSGGGGGGGCMMY